MKIFFSPNSEFSDSKVVWASISLNICLYVYVYKLKDICVCIANKMNPSPSLISKGILFNTKWDIEDLKPNSSSQKKLVVSLMTPPQLLTKRRDVLTWSWDIYIYIYIFQYLDFFWFTSYLLLLIPRGILGTVINGYSEILRQVLWTGLCKNVSKSL